MKPRVMALVVFTAVVGMVLAPGGQHPALAVIALICIAVGAGASGALNMWYDADIDALMQRTAARPIPRGRVTPEEALAFGVVLAVGSVAVLGVLVNWTAGGLLALTIAFYLFVYTMWLKRRTPQNIVIGGAAGAFPPMIGWAAMTGSVEPRRRGPVPHHLPVDAAAFLGAGALSRARLRARRACPCCPWWRGRTRPASRSWSTRRCWCRWRWCPPSWASAGRSMRLAAIGLGAVFLALALQVYRVREGREADRAARQLFGFSILYLFGLFAALLAERSLALWFA